MQFNSNAGNAGNVGSYLAQGADPRSVAPPDRDIVLGRVLRHVCEARRPVPLDELLAAAATPGSHLHGLRADAIEDALGQLVSTRLLLQDGAGFAATEIGWRAAAIVSA